MYKKIILILTILSVGIISILFFLNSRKTTKNTEEITKPIKDNISQIKDLDIIKTDEKEPAKNKNLIPKKGIIAELKFEKPPAYNFNERGLDSDKDYLTEK